MEITTVKLQGDGYLVNGYMSVPKAEGNRHYQAVLEWQADGGTVEPEFTQAELDDQAVAAFKLSRAEAVKAITVTTVSGKTFDGGEVAQGRMARAVTASNPGDTTTWVLADNTPATVSHEELKEALGLAGAAQTALWVG